ncbi:D-Ala-D-Ala carboxypeptidase family metallohydrolase [Rahnella aceris]|uniref:D-Ala-D-Ala carboxypeptidase family metallohydrolase n=1 Tax=Rahnella sp. (strain Y9602) TaxID=2703885 RepID=UPI001C279C6D|nr:D-Ala-D-Ala carboxypeptidase family metallohydrolase [Rahnella aceris]MBU9866803.1 serine/threonine protein kinase [Rahnella aceris]
MGDLSEHFSRQEFACRCGCGFCDIDPALVPVLEELREHFGQPVTINSACRCLVHNQNEGGAAHSQHLLGMAADIVVKNRTPALVADYLEHKYPYKYGIGRYSSFTHIDVRLTKARWRG